MKRGSGILLHISSLPAKYGVGDLGPAAFEFADFLSDAGQGFWQVLPLNPTDPAIGNSPYSSCSVFAGNILFISPDFLVRDGFLDKSDLEPVPSFPDEHCDYPGATEFKLRMIDTCYEKFRNSERKEEFELFCRENDSWLDAYSLFRAIKQDFECRPWSEWPDEYRFRDTGALDNARRDLAGSIEKEKFSQFLFHRQWSALKKYCNDRGVQIIGDMPIYVTYDSADVWSDPGIFKLDDRLEPLFVSGIPPDYFSETGQLWGNPVYDWDTLSDSGFAWWLLRFDDLFRKFDSVRIDHFLGLVSFWQVPAGEETAVNGEWVDTPFDDFMGAIQKRFFNIPVIAEDLGFITPDVREAIKRYNLPGMKVLQFAFWEDDPMHPYLPHSFPRNCVVYTGTHDNNTTRGWAEEEADENCLRRIDDYIGRKPANEDYAGELVRLAMSSVADISLIPMQDHLNLGSEARMNTPSVGGGNWEWMAAPGSFTGELARRIRDLSNTYGRV